MGEWADELSSCERCPTASGQVEANARGVPPRRARNVHLYCTGRRSASINLLSILRAGPKCGGKKIHALAKKEASLLTAGAGHVHEVRR